MRVAAAVSLVALVSLVAPVWGAEAPPPASGRKFVQLDVLDHEQYRDLQEKRLGRSAHFVLGPPPPPPPLGGDREFKCPDQQETTSVRESSASASAMFGDCAPQPDLVFARCRSCVVQSQPGQQFGVLLTCADCQHHHPARNCYGGGRSNRFDHIYRVAAAAFMVYEVERKPPDTAAVAIREAMPSEVMPREDEGKAEKSGHLLMDDIDDTDDVLIDHHLEDLDARDE